MDELMLCLYQLSGPNESLVIANLSVNSLFFTYAILALITKEVAYLAAFFAACLAVSVIYITDYQVYLVDLIIYSYIYFYAKNYKTKLACVIIMLLDLGMATDAIVYAETQTILYNNIEHLALLSHLLLIASIIPFQCIRICMADFFNSLRNIQTVNYFFVVFWYNNKNTYQR